MSLRSGYLTWAAPVDLAIWDRTPAFEKLLKVTGVFAFGVFDLGRAGGLGHLGPDTRGPKAGDVSLRSGYLTWAAPADLAFCRASSGLGLELSLGLSLGFP